VHFFLNIYPRLFKDGGRLGESVANDVKQKEKAMKFVSKMLIAFTFAGVATPAAAIGAIPVDGISAEKVGVPAGDFVTPEEAKAIAVKYFNTYGGVETAASEDQVIISPWVIEDWNIYKPEIFMGYYEIIVYNGVKRLESYDDGLKETVRDYVSRFTRGITKGESEVSYPDELLLRDDLTKEVLGDADVRTYWVRVNRTHPAVLEPAYDTAIGAGFVTPELGRQVIKSVFGFESAEYERTVSFGMLNVFNIFQVDGKEFYLQYGDKYNKTRFFKSTQAFNEYLDAERSVIDTNQLRRRRPWDPFESVNENGPSVPEEKDDLPASDSHLQPHVPNMRQGEYYGIDFYCGMSAMANLIAFWCGGGYRMRFPVLPGVRGTVRLMANGRR